ncbi:unnamed protein product [marine sediment metagenome]|uniref:Uncharacterized protein n=1 Tax=marine sediment metagenome TaxID=412755 RepID=X1F3B7_9ZZZZ
MKSKKWTERPLGEMKADEGETSLVPTLNEVLESRNFVRLLLKEYKRERKPFKSSVRLRTLKVVKPLT